MPWRYDIEENMSCLQGTFNEFLYFMWMIQLGNSKVFLKIFEIKKSVIVCKNNKTYMFKPRKKLLYLYEIHK